MSESMIYSLILVKVEVKEDRSSPRDVWTR